MMVRKMPEGGANPGSDCGLCGQGHVSEIHDVHRIEKAPSERLHLHMPPGRRLAATREMTQSSPGDESYLHPASPFQPGRDFFEVGGAELLFPCPFTELEHGSKAQTWSTIVNRHVGVPVSVGWEGSCGCRAYNNRFTLKSSGLGSGAVMWLQDGESERDIFVTAFSPS